MNSLNSVLVEGNLTRDPLVASTPKGTPVCNFTVASNRFYKQEDDFQKETSFFDVETWSKLAERCGDQLEKGRGVRVVGRLKQERWSDKEGNPRSRVKIVAEHVEFRRAKPPEEIDNEAADAAALAAAADAVAEEALAEVAMADAAAEKEVALAF